MSHAKGKSPMPREKCAVEQDGSKDGLEINSCFVPQSNIPEIAFIRLLTFLEDPKVCSNVKNTILQWMICVYPFLEKTSTFLQSYDQLLKLLTVKLLQPHLSHLLLIITTRDLITDARFQNIASIVKDSQSPYVLCLFHHCSKLMNANLEIEREIKVEFETLGSFPAAIKEKHPSYNPPSTTYYILLDQVDSPIPPYHFETGGSIVLTPPYHLETGGSNVLIPTSCDITEPFESLQLLRKPVKIIKILRSPLRRLILTSDIYAMKKTSIDDFILASMHAKIKDISYLNEILKVFHNIQRAVPEVMSVTKKLLDLDYVENLDTILGFLLYEPICRFDDIEPILNFVCLKVLRAEVSSKCDFICCLSDLYQNWFLMEQNTDSLSRDYSETPLASGAMEEINKLGGYIDLFFNVLLLETEFHPCLLNEILCHYVRVSKCHQAGCNYNMHPPTTIVFCAALFSLNSITLEGLSKLLMSLDSEIKKKERKSHKEQKERNVFTLYCNDMSQLLLLGKYTSSKKSHLLDNKVLEKLQAMKPNFEKHFQMHCHPALISDSYNAEEQFLKLLGLQRVTDKYLPKFLNLSQKKK